jgi:DNA invertase Pin-like site-specific DNA recombinase
MAKIGYMRISTEMQDDKLQEDALKTYGCDKIFSDVISGSKTTRPGLDACMSELQSGDSIVVWKLDRLGRSAQHLLTIVEDLKRRDVAFVSLKESCDTREIAGKLLFTILSAVAEFEKETIKIRVRAGMAAAKASGAKMGRDPILSYKYDEMLDMFSSGVSVRDVAKKMGVSKTLAAKVMSGRWEMMEPDEFKIDKDEFYSQAIMGSGGCHLWPQGEGAYGDVWLATPERLFKRNGRMTTAFPAHRISYYLAHGKLDRTKRVIQSCGNKRCINPKHLKQGES